MKIQIGPYKVLESGTIIGVAENTITFYIYDLIYDMVFKTEAPNTEPKLKFLGNEDNKKRVTIELTNFNNPLGAGNELPLLLANLNNVDVDETGKLGSAQLFLNYRIYSLNDNTGRTIHYTWLIKSN